MLTPLDGFQRNKKVFLYLVQPTQELNPPFAVLRNQLQNQNIKYTLLVGFDEVKQRMRDKVNKNIIVINSNKLAPMDIPKQIFNVNDNQIYCYPKKIPNYGYLAQPNNVSQLYKKYTGLPISPNTIILRSIKKDLQNLKTKKQNTQIYEIIMLMVQRSSNQQYQNLFNILKTYRNKIKIVNNQNDVGKQKNKKSLLILKKQSYDSMNKFIYQNRLDRDIDLAIFGYTKGLNKNKNFAIITDYPQQIIQYIQSSGTHLAKAKDNLNKLKLANSLGNTQGNINNNINGNGIISDPNSNNTNTGLFILQQGGQPSFGRNKFQTSNNNNNQHQLANGMNMNNGENMNINMNNGDIVTYQNNNNNNNNDNIPITSKISDISKQNSNKKGIKVIRKANNTNTNNTNNNNNNIDVLPTVSDDESRSQNNQPPIININTVQSQSQHEGIKLDNQIQFQDNTAQFILNKDKNITTTKGNNNNNDKPIMHWYLKPDINTINQNGAYSNKKPIFLLQSPKGQIYQMSSMAAGQPKIQTTSSINSNPSINNNGIAPIINNSPNKQYNSQQSIPGAANSPTNINTSTNKVGVPQQYTQKPAMHWSVKPDKNNKSPNFVGPLFQIKNQSSPQRILNNQNNQNNQIGTGTSSIRNIYPQPKSPLLPTASPRSQQVSYTSKKTLSDQQNSSNNKLKSQQQIRQNTIKIQTKYPVQNRIAQVSQQYRNSNLSYPIQDYTNTITNNSNVRISTNYTNSNNYLNTDNLQLKRIKTTPNQSNQLTIQQTNNNNKIYRSEMQRNNPAQYYIQDKKYNSPINIGTIDINSTNRPGNTIDQRSRMLQTNTNYIDTVQTGNKTPVTVYSTFNKSVQKQPTARVTSYDPPRQIQTYSTSSSPTIANNQNTNKYNNTTYTGYNNQPATAVITTNTTSNINNNTNNVDNGNKASRTSIYQAGKGYISVLDNPAYASVNRVIGNTLGYMGQSNSNSNNNSRPSTPTNTYNYTTNTVTNNNNTQVPINSVNNITRRSVFQANPTTTANNNNTNNNISTYNANPNITTTGTSSYNYTNIYASPTTAATTNVNNNNNNINSNNTSVSVSKYTGNNYEGINNIKTEVQQTKNKYMTNLGIDLSKYDVIQDNKGNKTYRLKTNTNNTPTTYTNNTNANTQSLQRYKSAPKLITNQTTSTYNKINSTNQIIGSPRQTTSSTQKNLFDPSQYQQHTDQRGRKYYTIKKNTNITTPVIKNQPVVTTGKAVNLRNSYSNDQLMMDTMKNTNGSYNLMLDSKKTGEIKGISPSSYNNVNGYTSGTIYSPTQQRQTTTTNTNTIYNPYNPYIYSPTITKNETTTNPSNPITSPTNTNTNNNGIRSNFTSPISISQNNDKIISNGAISRVSNNYGNIVGRQNNTINTMSSNNSSRIGQQYYSKSIDGKQKIYENNQKKIQDNKITQVNRRYTTGPNNVAKQILVKQKTPSSTKQLYQYQVKSTKYSPLKQQYISNTNNTNDGNINAINNGGYGDKDQSSQTRNYTSNNTSQHNTYNLQNNSNSNQSSQQSGLSRQSSFTDRSSSINQKIAPPQPRYYTQTKFATNNYHIQTQDQLQRIKQQFKILKTKSIYTHYIIDTTHPLRWQIQKLPNSQDKIVQIDNYNKIYQYMLDTALPNQYYDIGFIFVNGNDVNINKIDIGTIREGYYLVDINPNNPLIDIKKQRKKVCINNIKNLSTVKKLLMSPHIQNYIFFPKNSDVQLSKMLNLFPSTKFQKSNYTNRNDLQQLLFTTLKSKGRLTRALIFVNTYNINQIAPILDSNVNNYRNISMICNSKDNVDQRLKNQYKKVIFSNNFDFNSYGSVLSMANYADKSQIQIPGNNNNNNQYSMSSNGNNYPQQNKVQYCHKKDIIFIQNPHKSLESQLKKSFPGKYNYKYFTNASQIKERSMDNWIILHRQADNIGQKYDRNMGTLILITTLKNDKVPKGAITLNTEELIQSLSDS